MITVEIQILPCDSDNRPRNDGTQPQEHILRAQSIEAIERKLQALEQATHNMGRRFCKRLYVAVSGKHRPEDPVVTSYDKRLSRFWG